MLTAHLRPSAEHPDESRMHLSQHRGPASTGSTRFGVSCVSARSRSQAHNRTKQRWGLGNRGSPGWRASVRLRLYQPGPESCCEAPGVHGEGETGWLLSLRGAEARRRPASRPLPPACPSCCSAPRRSASCFSRQSWARGAPALSAHSHLTVQVGGYPRWIARIRDISFS